MSKQMNKNEYETALDKIESKLQATDARFMVMKILSK